MDAQTAARIATQPPPGPKGGEDDGGKTRGRNVAIRLAADMRDVECMIELGRVAHRESRFADLEYAPDKLMQSALGAMTEEGRKRMCLLMAEYRGDLLGMIVATVGSHWFSSELGASAMVYYVHPDHRGSMAAIKLLHGFRRWAQNRRVRRININVTSGVGMARTDKLMRRLGFEFTGGNYVLEMGSLR
ncbi:GNAT family N-acetyltransferase [Varunaivibrio sulfuroxidans]|nr:GNAT family N-acetyltransferase [Varunaivibrio sulfuroxidans]WES31870.1 GNAT family N-acetyltransferase [Varunaivibrio sulfuroxidans]